MSQKISAMTPSVTLQPTDQIPVVRSGQNLRVPASAFGSSDTSAAFELIASGSKASLGEAGDPIEYTDWVLTRVAGSGEDVEGSGNTFTFNKNGVYKLSFSTTVTNYGSYGTPSSFASNIVAKMFLVCDGVFVIETVPGASGYSVLSMANPGISLDSANINQTLLITITGVGAGSTASGRVGLLLLPTNQGYGTMLDARAFVTVKKLQTLM